MFRVLIIFFKRKIGISPASTNYFKLLFFFLVLFWFSSAGFLYFELPQKPDLNWADAMWWTLVTMTTVGYGDYFPESFGGRYIIAIPTMVFGIGFLGFIISEIATKLIDTRSKRLQGMLKINEEDHILIFNYTNLQGILKIIDEISMDESTMDKKIILVDESLQELPRELIDRDVLFVKGDPTDEEVLQRANLTGASHCIILAKDANNPRSDDLNLSITLMIEKINANIYSIVEIINPKKVRQLEFAGADSVICVSQFTSNLIIQELQDPGIQKVLETITSNQIEQNIYIVPLKKTGKHSYGVLLQKKLTENYSILGIYRNGESIINCEHSFPLDDDDKVILIAGKRPAEIVL